jgi:hypothetical protein
MKLQWVGETMHFRYQLLSASLIAGVSGPALDRQAQPRQSDIPLPELGAFLKGIRAALHSDRVLLSQYTYKKGGSTKPMPTPTTRNSPSKPASITAA